MYGYLRGETYNPLMPYAWPTDPVVPPHLTPLTTPVMGGSRPLDPPPGRGPLMGGPQCRMSILRNGKCPLSLFFNFPVDLE